MSLNLNHTQVDLPFSSLIFSTWNRWSSPTVGPIDTDWARPKDGQGRASVLAGCTPSTTGHCLHFDSSIPGTHNFFQGWFLVYYKLEYIYIFIYWIINYMILYNIIQSLIIPLVLAYHITVHANNPRIIPCQGWLLRVNYVLCLELSPEMGGYIF